MLRQMAVFVLITVMGSILWGCQTTEDIGIQKISYLKSSTLRTYGNYHNTLMRHEDKSPTGVFAYDPITNRSGYSVSWGGNDAYSAAKRRAREACEKGNSCQIFDIDGRVVWKNISPEITRKLAAIANKRSNATPSQKVVEYKSSIFEVSYVQLRRFQDHVSEFEASESSYDNAAFFVSSDGVVTGSSLTNGNNSYHDAMMSGHTRCVSNSHQKCYLFAKDGKPVNPDALAAMK